MFSRRHVFASRLAVAACVGLFAAACGGGGSDGAAADTIELKVADSLPTEHVFSREGVVHWMEQIEEQSDGRVQFEHYPAGQLAEGAELLSAVNDGLTDISYIVPAYVSDQLPLATIGALPGLYESSSAATVPYWKLINGELLDDFKDQGVRPVMTTVAPRYQPMVSGSAINDLSDLSGAKLRSPGGVQDIAINALGATPVSMPAPEVFTSMQRGTVDGTVLPLASIEGYGIAELLDGVTQNAPLGGTMPIMAMNEDVWNELPKDIQEIFLDAAPDASQHAADAWQSESEAMIGKLEEQGVEVTELDDSQIQAWVEELSSVSEQWVEARESDGLPGQATLDEWKRLLEAE